MRMSLCLGAIATLYASVAACAVEPEIGPEVESPEVELVPEGLVVRQDPVRSNLHIGTFRRGPHVIRFETLRGELNPALTPTTTLYAIDVRIADEHGQVFFLQAGGDTFQDPTWEEDMGGLVDEATREEAWALVEALSAEDLSAALAERTMGDAIEAYASEVRALDGIARIASQRAAIDTKSIDVTPEMGEQTPYATYYHHGFRIYWNWLVWPIAHHSATSAFVETTSGKLLWWAQRCNHGDCPSGMNYKCGRGRTSTSSNLRVRQSCGTYYNASSEDGGHNCHDDSRLQNRSWYWNTTYRTSSSTYFAHCKDSYYGSTTAPGCYP